MQTDERLGQILLRLKAINTKTLAIAITEQQRLRIEGNRSFKIGELLVFMQEIDLPRLHQALSLQRKKAQTNRDFAVKAFKKEDRAAAARQQMEAENKTDIVSKLRSFFSRK